MQALGLQFVLYLFVGGISAVLDIGGFLALQYAGIGYIAASVSSFVAATILNYFLSYVLAFTRGKYSQRSEVIRFWLVSLVGLLINTIVVWLVVTEIGALPIVGKVVAVPVVLVWNFAGRRLFVFHKDLPPAAMAVVSRRSAR
ncbi:MAG TPA: GtrA family protein [Alphaproteobacteria bacterium]|nr:GtrA family protein [Alphaproteobacteria bacterium]